MLVTDMDTGRKHVTLDDWRYQSPSTQKEIENLKAKNKGRLPFRKCIVCGIRFEHFKANAAYCSDRCRNKRLSEKRLAKLPPPIHCPTCGKRMLREKL